MKLIFSLEEEGKWVSLFLTPQKKALLPLQQSKRLMKMTNAVVKVIYISLRYLYGYAELCLMWSHSYGKLLRCLLIVILFQMFTGNPDAAGAAVGCIGSFNLSTAIKLQSHMGSLGQVSLFGEGLPTGNICFLSFRTQN